MNDLQKLYELSLFLNEPIYLIKSDVVAMPDELPLTKLINKTVLPPFTDYSKIPQTQPADKSIEIKPAEKKPAVKNKTKLMILFNNEQSPYLKKTEEALLQKILLSIHLTIDDVELVNYNNIKNINYIDLLKEKVLNQLISFGISLTELNLDIRLQKYRVEKIEGISILLADTLSVLEADLEKKKLLWKALQQMFMKPA